MNLDHDGDSIHEVNNQWVDDLDQMIQKELALVEDSLRPAAAVDRNFWIKENIRLRSRQMQNEAERALGKITNKSAIGPRIAWRR